MTLRFGTDGVRGVANSELTPELVVALGRAAARVLPARSFLVGRDTRRSGPLLQAALSAGLASEGADVVDLGVVPTPAVAHASASQSLPAAVISASHNPFPDNGIKLFSSGGKKLTDEVEERLELELAGLLPAGSGDRAPTGAEVGALRADRILPQDWTDAVVASVEGRSLHGLRVVIDCANGAASGFAADVLRRLRATVETISDRPNGTNINAGCGSNDPAALQRAVVESGAHAGLAFDGDADRVVAVDEKGQLVDGDRILALLATDLHRRNRLRGGTVVVTVMTNLGFRLAMADRGIAVHEVAVGDRYVLEALDAGSWSLGGEQSGHIILADLATTGDGLLAGVQLLDLLLRSGSTLGPLASAAMTRLPQVLQNVKVADREGLAGADEIWAEVARIESQLRGRGRVLLRPSGTEPLVRVMVEAPTEQQAAEVAAGLVATVERALGRPAPQRPTTGAGGPKRAGQ